MSSPLRQDSRNWSAYLGLVSWLDTNYERRNTKVISREEAEAAGWVFVHDAPEQIEVTSSIQGEQRITPASLRAEKSLSRPGRLTALVNESAEMEELLLERIELFEAVH
jgi:hypothetical protein